LRNCGKEVDSLTVNPPGRKGLDDDNFLQSRNCLQSLSNLYFSTSPNLAFAPAQSYGFKEN